MSYNQGFMDKCAEHGVDPEALIKLAISSDMLGGANPGFYGFGGLGINQTGRFAGSGYSTTPQGGSVSTGTNATAATAVKPKKMVDAVNRAAVGITGSPKVKGGGQVGMAQAWQGESGPRQLNDQQSEIQMNEQELKERLRAMDSISDGIFGKKHMDKMRAMRDKGMKDNGIPAPDYGKKPAKPETEDKSASVRIPLYSRLLTRGERLECISTGMILKSAAEGIPCGMDKSAGLLTGATGAADMGTKAVVALSLLTGIPIGIAGHLIHNSVKRKKLKEREALQKIDFYRDAADSVEDAMAKQTFEI